jgi:hypothetical protein
MTATSDVTDHVTELVEQAMQAAASGADEASWAATRSQITAQIVALLARPGSSPLEPSRRWGRSNYYTLIRHEYRPQWRPNTAWCGVHLIEQVEVDEGFGQPCTKCVRNRTLAEDKAVLSDPAGRE